MKCNNIQYNKCNLVQYNAIQLSIRLLSIATKNNIKIKKLETIMLKGIPNFWSSASTSSNVSTSNSMRGEVGGDSITSFKPA